PPASNPTTTSTMQLNSPRQIDSRTCRSKALPRPTRRASLPVVLGKDRVDLPLGVEQGIARRLHSLPGRFDLALQDDLDVLSTVDDRLGNGILQGMDEGGHKAVQHDLGIRLHVRRPARNEARLDQESTHP